MELYYNYYCVYYRYCLYVYVGKDYTIALGVRGVELASVQKLNVVE